MDEEKTDLKEQTPEPVISDRTQIVIGAIISLVLASLYIFFTSDSVDEPIRQSPAALTVPDSRSVAEPDLNASLPLNEPEKNIPSDADTAVSDELDSLPLEEGTVP